MHTQFAFDFHLSPAQVMDMYGVPAAQRPRLLRQLSLLYGVALENRERGGKS